MRQRAQRKKPVVGQMTNGDLALYIHLLSYISQGKDPAHPYCQLLASALYEAGQRLDVEVAAVHESECTCEDCGVERGWWQPALPDPMEPFPH